MYGYGISYKVTFEIDLGLWEFPKIDDAHNDDDDDADDDDDDNDEYDVFS